MQVAEAPVASRTDGFAELKQQLDTADADIVLVNKRLDEAHGECFFPETPGKRSLMPVSYNVCA